MSLPSLSIVIPAMNERKMLPLLLTSIAQQTLRPLEVVVADAHSTDATREIAQSFGADVVEGGLPSFGRNRGAEATTGEVILFLDADVVLSDAHFLSRMLYEFESRALDVATADVVVDSDRRYDRIAHWVYNVYVRLWGARHAHAPGFFIVSRRSLYESIGGFDEGIVFAEDHDYAKRAAAKGRFGILNAVKITTSVRRYDKDGRFTIAWKFIRAELYLLTKGSIRDDRFHYEFGYDDDDERKK